MRCRVEHEKRNSILYLQETMYYFVYHINTIALFWEEKPTSLMNENKCIDNPRITIVERVGADLRWRIALNHDYKNFHIYAGPCIIPYLLFFCNLLVHFVKLSKSFTTEVIKNIIGMLSHFIS